MEAVAMPGAVLSLATIISTEVCLGADDNERDANPRNRGEHVAEHDHRHTSPSDE
jgi:hypothetical protein